MAFEVAADLSEVDVGETLLVELAEPICLVRVGEDDVRAIHDTCTHQQQPLHEGTVDENTLVCAAHAATFDLDTGESIGVPDVDPIAVYACKVEGDAVLVDLDHRLNDAVPRWE
jgi:3-phenylpropionate/trans-cinnamate dioxygenase ferredoxin subunit